MLVVNRREYYKGEGDGFPKIQAMVNLVNPCMPVARLCIKNASIMH
jgi:hypothetical protein